MKILIFEMQFTYISIKKWQNKNNKHILHWHAYDKCFYEMHNRKCFFSEEEIKEIAHLNQLKINSL